MRVTGFIFGAPGVRARGGRGRAEMCAIEDGGEVEKTEEELKKERQRQANARYRKKVEERLRGSSVMDASAGESADDMANIPDNLDELDDMAMNRGPLDAGKVAMWGAWLDEDVAGRKAGKTGDAAEADRLFQIGLANFQRGRYLEATKELTAAALTAGISSREGGQYQLWLGQAWDAAGDKKKAVLTLQTLKGHKDADVRKVADELLFIITAPPLELGEEAFAKIDTSTEFNPARKKGQRRISSVPTKIIQKEPEKYTLDWFLRKKKEEPLSSKNDKLVFAVVVLLTVGFAVASQLDLPL